MPRYVVAYELHGDHPTHARMASHMETVGRKSHKLINTVWLVVSDHDAAAVEKEIRAVLSPNDALLVVEAAAVARSGDLKINQSGFDALWAAGG